jgi:hypothetical protein
MNRTRIKEALYIGVLSASSLYFAKQACDNYASDFDAARDYSAYAIGNTVGALYGKRCRIKEFRMGEHGKPDE